MAAASPIQDPMISTTTSTCKPEKSRGEHVFRIDGYSLYKGVGVGKFIPSATFSVGGHDWCLRYYPDGYDEASKDSVSVYLFLMSNDVEVRATFHLTLVAQATGWPGQYVWPKLTAPMVFGRSVRCWGYPKFFKRTELEELSYTYIPNDVLLIKCELTVIKLRRVHMWNPRMRYGIQVPPSSLSDNLRSLLEAGDETDVSFKVKDEIFTAHKIVLAMRSPVFKAEFYGPLRDKCEQSITIEDMEPAVFRALLKFIYTDKLPPLADFHNDDKEEVVKHLLVAADRYAMERLKLMCERILCHILRPKTVASTLALADQHHCIKLKDVCIGFINSLDRKDDVMTSTGYKHLKRACPTIFADIWEKAAKKRNL